VACGSARKEGRMDATTTRGAAMISQATPGGSRRIRRQATTEGSSPTGSRPVGGRCASSALLVTDISQAGVENHVREIGVDVRERDDHCGHEYHAFDDGKVSVGDRLQCQ